MTSNAPFDLVELDSLPQSWEVRKLKDVAFINQETTNLRDYSWIHYTDISSVGTRTVEMPSKLDVKDAPSRARRVLRKGDTVISSVRPNRKSFFFFNEEWTNAIASTGFAVLSPKDFDDAEYLHAVLTSEKAVKIYEAICEGGAYPAFNPSRLNEIRIPWPPYAVRRELGHTVVNLQSKIVANNALSKTLEDIAQTIFKSWFIDFDPVKAKMAGETPAGMDSEKAALFSDSMEESELGLIPKGWEVHSLDEISDYLNGLAMQKFPVIDENDQLPVIKIAQLRAGNTQGADVASGLLDPRFIIKDGDILFSWSGTLEVETWAGGAGALNQHLFKVTGKNVPDWYSYLSTKSFLSFFREIASGKATTMGHIQRGNLTESKLAIPNSELMKHATEIIEPIISLKIKTSIESRNLTEIRDSLLPRLISGELEIPEEMLAS